MIELDPEEMQELLLYDPGDATGRIKLNELASFSRWALDYRLVFVHTDGKLYETFYSVGATEVQEGPFEHDDTVECFEVEGFDVIITDFRRV